MAHLNASTPEPAAPPTTQKRQSARLFTPVTPPCRDHNGAGGTSKGRASSAKATSGVAESADFIAAAQRIAPPELDDLLGKPTIE